jgi:hypothetical protein
VVKFPGYRLKGSRFDFQRYKIFLVVLVLERGSLSFVRIIEELLGKEIVPSSPILVTLMIEAICSSETSVRTKAMWRYVPEGGMLHSHHRENLKSYIAASV